MDATLFAFIVVYGIALLIGCLVGIVFYVFYSIGLYTLAKRRGIPHPGLAWVPIGGGRWILGSLSDQYIYCTEGKAKRMRHLLLWLEIGYYIIAIALISTLVSLAIRQEMMNTLVGGVLVCYLLFIAIAIVYVVFQYIALYRVYKSCDPQNTTLFLVLSIVINVTMPFFVFACRNKDLGMPPAGGPAEEEALPEPNA